MPLKFLVTQTFITLNFYDTPDKGVNLAPQSLISKEQLDNIWTVNSSMNSMLYYPSEQQMELISVKWNVDKHLNPHIPCCDRLIELRMALQQNYQPFSHCISPKYNKGCECFCKQSNPKESSVPLSSTWGPQGHWLTLLFCHFETHSLSRNK